MSKSRKVFIVASLFAVVLCSAVAKAETVYFLVAEANQANPVHGDSYVLPLSNPNDISAAREILVPGYMGSVNRVVANIAAGDNGINRNYLSPPKVLYSWHVTSFVNFVTTVPPATDGYPRLVQNDVPGWINSKGSQIGFQAYTLIAELGTDPKHWDSDYVQDGQINYKDFAAFAQQWLNSGCVSPGWCGGTDLDKNGVVDNNDLEIFTEAWLSVFATQPQNWPSAWNCPTQCHGDADCSTEVVSKSTYRVGSNDLNILMAAMGPFGSYDPRADFNRDGKVDATDQGRFLDWYERDNVPTDCPTDPDAENGKCDGVGQLFFRWQNYPRLS